MMGALRAWLVRNVKFLLPIKLNIKLLCSTVVVVINKQWCQRGHNPQVWGQITWGQEPRGQVHDAVHEASKALKFVIMIHPSGSQPEARGPKVARQASKSGPRPPKEF